MERKYNIGDHVKTGISEGVIKLCYESPYRPTEACYAVELKGASAGWLQFTKDTFLKSRTNIIGDADSIDFTKTKFVYESDLSLLVTSFIEDDE